MPIKLNSSGGGSVTLQEPNTANAVVITLPSSTATLVTTGDTGSVSTTMLANEAVTPAKMSQKLTLATAQNTTSGTNIDFTGIPSWVKKITVVFKEVSTNGNDPVQIQLGTSSGIDASGYTSGAFEYNSGSSSISTSGLVTDQGGATRTRSGVYTLALLGSNAWSGSGVLSTVSTGNVAPSAGTKTLSSTLDRVRITTTGGSNTFDGGSVNIMYEG